jgi:hypothetical protein
MNNMRYRGAMQGEMKKAARITEFAAKAVRYSIRHLSKPLQVSQRTLVVAESADDLAQAGSVESTRGRQHVSGDPDQFSCPLGARRNRLEHPLVQAVCLELKVFDMRALVIFG